MAFRSLSPLAKRTVFAVPYVILSGGLLCFTFCSWVCAAFVFSAAPSVEFYYFSVGVRRAAQGGKCVTCCSYLGFAISPCNSPFFFSLINLWFSWYLLMRDQLEMNPLLGSQSLSLQRAAEKDFGGGGGGGGWVSSCPHPSACLYICHSLPFPWPVPHTHMCL